MEIKPSMETFSKAYCSEAKIRCLVHFMKRNDKVVAPENNIPVIIMTDESFTPCRGSVNQIKTLEQKSAFSSKRTDFEQKNPFQDN